MAAADVLAVAGAHIPRVSVPQHHQVRAALDGLSSRTKLMRLVGRFFDNPLLLRVAYAYQHSTDWQAIISIATRQREKVLA
ncbi:MAG: hypothetical protein JOY78_15085 [Pseudonocardia sp.]|nr:hypothetical protein [Pseudonocardia sp.]